MIPSVTCTGVLRFYAPPLPWEDKDVFNDTDVFCSTFNFDTDAFALRRSFSKYGTHDKDAQLYGHLRKFGIWEFVNRYGRFYFKDKPVQAIRTLNFKTICENP